MTKSIPDRVAEVLLDEEKLTTWENHYYCPGCDLRWTDTWTAQCDDECPGCGCDYTPRESVEVE
jgi:hypothetical protein